MIGNPVSTIIEASHRIRTNVVPTHFTKITVDGVSLEEAIEHYLDWIEGRGAAATRRPFQGVPYPLDRQRLTTNSGGEIRGENGLEIATRSSENKFVLKFIHRDDQHSDVFWHSIVRIFSEVPLKGKKNAVGVEHGTGRMIPPYKKLPPVAGAPAVLARLLKIEGARPRNRDLVKRDLIRVRSGEAEGFVRHILLDANRSLPILLVSPEKDSGRALVDSKMLAQRLETQVLVAEIETDATWEFAEAFEAGSFKREIGQCFDGAVRLYYPGLYPGQDPREHYLWLPYRLQFFEGNATDRLAGEVAGRCAWKALPPRFFLALEDIDRERSRERAEAVLQKRIEDVSTLEEKVELLQGHIETLRTQLQDAQMERKQREDEAKENGEREAENYQLLEIAEQERDEAKNQKWSLEARIKALKARNQGLTHKQIEALRNLANSRVKSLSDALLLLETLFSERFEILQSARKSAEKAVEFKYPDKAWDLLKTLASQYWESIQNGGDSVAKGCFTENTFASRESESVENKKEAMKRRTFRYNGREIIMWKHLKIGIKDSISETWRCHFEFDQKKKVIVIGHCGRHLEFK